MDSLALFESMVRAGACISPCGTYRYWLTRTWDADRPVVTFIMLNPSVADASQDDPTIRRVVGFAKAWDCGGICVVNLFAFRATKPDDLWRAGPAMVGPENDAHILAATEGRRVIAAWGAMGNTDGRDEHVMGLLEGRIVECLGRTKDGHPRHPLYVAAAAMPTIYCPGPRVPVAAPAGEGGKVNA